MEDLDSLLEDLGRGKGTSTSAAAKKQRPPSSRVDLNELEDLMEDLAAPTSKQAPAPTPVVIPNKTTPSSSSSPTLSSAGKTNGASSSAHNSVAPDSVKPSTATMDDLDALMESLNATSSKGSRRSVQTKPEEIKPVIAPPTPVAPVSAPKQAPSTASVRASSTYNSPPSTSSSAYSSSPSTNNNNYNNPSSYGGSSSSSSYSPSSSASYANNTSSTTAAPRPAKDDLDSLLQNLTQQMNNIDSENPSSRGTCATCNCAILGEVIQALGKTYHPEHFTCGNCREPLGTRNFFEVSNSPHCERCFQEMFCPRCAHCDKPVMDRCITALGKKWHVEHFICTQCLRPFQGGNFFERDGRPYCEEDFYGLYAPKCGSCNEPIRGDCINALGVQWHPEHFACTYCQKSFANGVFFEYAGKPYCETHYHQQTGSLCSGCGKPITGRCVNALDKKWHPEHFVCAFCMNPLAGGSFTEHNNKAYCKECHGKLFGN